MVRVHAAALLAVALEHATHGLDKPHVGTTDYQPPAAEAPLFVVVKDLPPEMPTLAAVHLHNQLTAAIGVYPHGQEDAT